MKLSTLYLAVLLTGVLAIPNPEAAPEALAEPVPEPEALPGFGHDLVKRDCKELSKKQCSALAGTKKSGVYCARCPEVQGTHWRTHKDWAYQLNAKTKACCTYGLRKSCQLEPFSLKKSCPV